MNELPIPTLPLSAPSRSRGGSQPPHHGRREPQCSGISAAWARHQDEVREAQRLRYQVFAGEMGARLDTRIPGHDIDLFDDYCEHLIVRELASGQAIGTYRVLTPTQAKRVGGRPRLPLPLESLDDSLDVEPPALIKGYLRLGSRVLGPPAWDPDFNSADLPLMMRLSDLPARYRKHFLG